MAKSKSNALRLETLQEWKKENGIPKKPKLLTPNEIYNPNVVIRHRDFDQPQY